MVLTTRSFASVQIPPETYQTNGPALLGRVSCHMMVELMTQIGQVSQYAADIFEGLAHEAKEVNVRISNITTRVENIENLLPALDTTFASSDPAVFYTTTVESNWKRQDIITDRLFSAENRPAPIEKIRQQAFVQPSVQMLNHLSSIDCKKLYSDPDFFFDQWLAEKEKEFMRDKETKSKKKKKKRAAEVPKMQVTAIEVKKFSQFGAEFGTSSTESVIGSSASAQQAQAVLQQKQNQQMQQSQQQFLATASAVDTSAPPTPTSKSSPPSAPRPTGARPPGPTPPSSPPSAAARKYDNFSQPPVAHMNGIDEDNVFAAPPPPTLNFVAPPSMAPTNIIAPPTPSSVNHHYDDNEYSSNYSSPTSYQEQYSPTIPTAAPIPPPKAMGIAPPPPQHQYQQQHQQQQQHETSYHDSIQDNSYPSHSIQTQDSFYNMEVPEQGAYDYGTYHAPAPPSDAPRLDEIFNSVQQSRPMPPPPAAAMPPKSPLAGAPTMASPPPSRPNPFGGAGGPPRGGLLSAIQSGAKLRKVEVEDKKPAPSSGGNGMGGLLSAIQGGAKLRKVEVEDKKPAPAVSASPAGGLGALTGVMGILQRRKLLESESEGDDDDWDDE